MAIGTADDPTTQTKAKADHETSQAVFSKMETALQDRKEKTLCAGEEVR
jgi:hypothetical protein